MSRKFNIAHTHTHVQTHTHTRTRRTDTHTYTHTHTCMFMFYTICADDSALIMAVHAVDSRMLYSVSLSHKDIGL